MWRRWGCGGGGDVEVVGMWRVGMWRGGDVEGWGCGGGGDVEGVGCGEVDGMWVWRGVREGITKLFVLSDSTEGGS